MSKIELSTINRTKLVAMALGDTPTGENMPGQKPNGYLAVGDNVYANVIGWPESTTAQEVNKNDDNVNEKVMGWLETTCGDGEQWFIPGECENKHRTAKVIACGKEWCQICGKRGSLAHNRRYVRWLPKIMQFKSMRYLVFTIPENERCKYRTKKSLTILGHQVQEMLKRHGFTRGLRRWHWFGDKSKKYHPHLNVLVEGSFMDKSVLDSIKHGWSRILNVKTIHCHTNYKPTARDMAGCLHYVTRATFLDYQWDIELAIELHKFRNMVVWGKGLWNNKPVWELGSSERAAIEGEKIDVDAIENIVHHICPRCGTHISWNKALPASLLRTLDKESYGAGYYRIIDRRPPPEELPDDVRKRLARLKMEWLGRILLSNYDNVRVGLSQRYYRTGWALRLLL